MTTNVIMPQMGESIFEGTITKWLKKAGEAVRRDEPLFEISTDKVDSEIPSPAEGILAEILVSAGQTVQVNTVVAVIKGEDEKSSPPLTAIEKTSSSSDVAAPEGGSGGITAAETDQIAQRDQSAVATRVQPKNIRTSPLVRKIAREFNVDLEQVRGTGFSGRITKLDILGYIDERDGAAKIAPGLDASAIPMPSPEISAAEPDEAAFAETPPVAIKGAAAQMDTSVPIESPRFSEEAQMVPMTAMRKSIAEHMVLSKHTSPHVNTVFEVDITPMVQLREKHKVEFERKEGVKLTYTPFFVKALVETVREFPVFNSSVQGNNIVQKKAINVGIAVSLDNGLIVPVVKNAQLKSFTGLALAIQDLASRARTKRLRPEEVQNGTISVTNPGPYGGLFATPIINQPQVAILGIGGIEKRPVVIDDAIAIRSMVYLSLSFDHRIIDGAVADQFMAKMKERLQNWKQWIE